MRRPHILTAKSIDGGATTDMEQQTTTCDLSHSNFSSNINSSSSSGNNVSSLSQWIEGARATGRKQGSSIGMSGGVDGSPSRQLQYRYQEISLPHITYGVGDDDDDCDGKLR